MSTKLKQRVIAEAEDIDLEHLDRDAAIPAMHHHHEEGDALILNYADTRAVDAPSLRGHGEALPSAPQSLGYEEDVLDALNVLRHRGGDAPLIKPRIGARRLGIQQQRVDAAERPLNVYLPTPPHQPMLFDNAGDDVIKFRHDDEAGDDDDDSAAATSTDSDVSASDLSRRRRRKADRDFDDASEERKLAEEEEALYGSGSSGDDSDETGYEEDDEESPTDASSASEDDDESSASAADGPTAQHPPVPHAMSTSRGFGAGRAGAAQPPTQPLTSPLGRSHYSGVTFETHYNNTSGSASSFGCYHTLLGLTTSQSIRGPCAVYGIYGEASCGGFLLGQKHFVLPNASDAVVLQPVQKLATAASQLTAAELQRLAVQRCASAAAGGGAAFPSSDAPEYKEDALLVAQDPALMFGAVDWSWATDTLHSWLSRLAANKSMSVVLIVQRYVPGELMTRRVSFKKSADHVDRYGTGDGMVIPGCFARRQLPIPIDAALMPVFRRMMSSAQSVAVVGGQNIGKSTLCRALANGFLSQHGVCYWLDLDLGRPEFGVSGSLSVSRIRSPLMRESDFEAAEWVKVVHVGGARMQCPETMALAIAAACDFVEQHHGTWLRPLVINTHGWIHSTGRRSTVEVLRRLCPQHVIHMMRHGDPSWAVPEVLYDPRCGLNRRVVLERFRGTIPSAMPEAAGARNNAQTQPTIASTTGGKAKGPTGAPKNAVPPQQTPSMQVHALMVAREDFGAKKSRHARQDSWRFYFRPLQHWKSAAARTLATASSSVMTLSLSQSGATREPLGPVLAMPHDDLEVVDVRRFLSTIARSVVAFGLVPCAIGSGNRKRPRTEDSSTNQQAGQGAGAGSATSIVLPQHILPSAEFLGYGLVLSSWKEMEDHNHIRMAIPLAMGALQKAFDRVGADGQRLFLLACPYEVMDTSFLMKMLEPGSR